jgi:ribosomal protein S18 acetylase RimI-like enzyme
MIRDSAHVPEPPTFDLPAVLRAQGFALRPETDDDIPFLTRLYASTREAELAAVPWTEEQKREFVALQFAAQRRHYATHIAGCAFDILECRGEPVGRLYLETRPFRLHIVDITLLPAWRGRGVGAQILQAVIAAGRKEGRGVGIFVEKFNPALRLYRRLGFAELDDAGVYLEMERAAEQADGLESRAGGESA